MYHVMLSVPLIFLIASATPNGTKCYSIIIIKLYYHYIVTFSGCDITGSNFCRLFFILENRITVWQENLVGKKFDK